MVRRRFGYDPSTLIASATLCPSLPLLTLGVKIEATSGQTVVVTRSRMAALQSGSNCAFT